MKKFYSGGQCFLEYIVIFAVVIVASLLFFPKISQLFSDYISNAAVKMK